MATVVIADDHELVRTGIRRLIAELDCEIVGEAASGEEAVEQVRGLHPDIALIDIHMPGIGGLEASQRIHRIAPDCRVVILTAHTEGPLPRQLLGMGVAGFLTKGCAFEEMQVALDKIRRGERYVSKDVAQRLALDAATDGEKTPFDRLAPRELQVTLMFIAGTANGVIAETLNVSPKTVTTYRRRIFAKLGVANMADLWRVAVHYDLVTADQTP